MVISLGMSDEVKPLFEIKSEKKDHIFYDIYYKKIGDRIEIILPSKKEKRRKKLSPAEGRKKTKTDFCLRIWHIILPIRTVILGLNI